VSKRTYDGVLVPFAAVMLLAGALKMTLPAPRTVVPTLTRESAAAV
jgi:hypothetical protein